MKLSSPKLKKLFIFQEKLAKLENQKNFVFCLLRENFSNINAKEVTILPLCFLL